MRRQVGIVGLLLAVLALPVLSAAEIDKNRPSGPGAEPNVATAPVVLDGKTLFLVRGIAGYPAERRAKEISERIRAIALDNTIPLQALHLIETDEASIIRTDDLWVFAVTDGDALIEGVERDKRPTLAKLYLSNVVEAIKAHRQSRSPQELLNNTLYALGATVLFVVVLLVLRWAFRLFDSRAERIMKETLKGLETASRQFLRAEHLWGALRQGLRTLLVVIILAGAYQYIEFVLGLFPWTRAFSEGMLSLFLDPLSVMGKSFVRSIPDLVFLVLLAVVTRFLLRAFRHFFATVGQGKVSLSGFEPEWALSTYKILRFVIVAFAVVVAYPYIPGSSSAAFKGVSLFLGVIMSFGSTSLISNVLAGYSLIYRRAFRLGDRIQVDGHMGDVVEIRNMVTHIRTPKNEEVVLPNSTILNSHVVNYSALAKKQGLILHATVGIGYETPWRQVEAMLFMAAERTPGLLREPPPFVLAPSLGDFAVTYELNVYCNDPAAMFHLYSALHKNILDVFNEYGVQIMTPSYRGDTEQPKIVPRDQWFAPPAKEPPENPPA
jgi:small-conductance mechanosensitive channel